MSRQQNVVLLKTCSKFCDTRTTFSEFKLASSRKVEIEGTPTAIFIKTLRYDCCSVSPT